MKKSGTAFEGEIRQSMKESGLYFIRLYGLMVGGKFHFGKKARPPFDYLCFFPVTNCAFECKSISKSTRFPLKNLSEEQEEQLSKFELSGLNRKSFILLNFRLGRNMNVVWAIPIFVFKTLKKDHKSIKIKELIDNQIPGIILLDHLKGSMWNVLKLGNHA